MRVYSIYRLILCLTFSTPAAAQRAEVLRFVSNEALPLGDPSDIGVNLIDEFNALPVDTPRAEPVPNASRIPVPAWMRSGAASLQAVPEVFPAAVTTAAPCADVGYRPRRGFGILTEARRIQLFPAVAQIACEEGVPIGLFDALIAQESRYDISAISPKGAIGLTQLMPGTARELGVFTPWDPVANLRGGARYLRSHLLEFKRVDLALAAYNAGPGRIRQLWQVPAFAETQHYVSAITRAWAATFPRITTVIPSSLAVTPARNMRALRSVQVVTYTTATKPEVL